MSWFNPQRIEKKLNPNQVQYEKKVFEIGGYYMWRNGQGVSEVVGINGAVVRHFTYDKKGKWLGEQTNTLDYFSANTSKRVKPKR